MYVVWCVNQMICTGERGMCWGMAGPLHILSGHSRHDESHCHIVEITCWQEWLQRHNERTGSLDISWHSRHDVSLKLMWNSCHKSRDYLLTRMVGKGRKKGRGLSISCQNTPFKHHVGFLIRFSRIFFVLTTLVGKGTKERGGLSISCRQGGVSLLLILARLS